MVNISERSEIQFNNIVRTCVTHGTRTVHADCSCASSAYACVRGSQEHSMKIDSREESVHCDVAHTLNDSRVA